MQKSKIKRQNDKCKKLDKDILYKFVLKSRSACRQFFVWMYAYNNYVDFCKKNKVINYYDSFWSLIIPTLQHFWVLSIARITLDSAFYEKSSRLNLNYIKEILSDNENIITNFKSKHGIFINSVKDKRDKLIAHLDLKTVEELLENPRAEKIKKGVENFFSDLEKLVEDIKKTDNELKDCENINLKYIKKRSREGVKEIFKAMKVGH